MKNIQKKTDIAKKGINPIGTVVTGVAIVAGVAAVAGAVALSDENNRNMIVDIFQDKKRVVETAVKTAKDSVHRASNDVNEAVKTI